MKDKASSINTIRRFNLLCSIFITGACVLILEITATRILSPYFGTSIYTISSVITVILLALSIGYYIGGKVSDKYPSVQYFFCIIYGSGICVFCIFLLNVFILPQVAYTFSLISGPLIFSILLFFLPSFLLGTLSPYVIKLMTVQNRKNEIGSISGSVFFWSTAGSIIGSISTGFFLIPTFGVNQIIIGVGITLLVTSLVGLFSLLKRRKFILLCVIAFIMLEIVLVINSLSRTNKEIVLLKDGTYQKILIFDRLYKEKPTRFIRLDRSASGAMYLNSSEHVYDYSSYYALYKTFTPRAKDILVIGGAAYTIPKAYLNSSNIMHVDVAEIEPQGFEIAQKYFNIPVTPRLKNYTQDGRRFLYDSPKKYDVIVGDAYNSHMSVPEHLITYEFFQLAKNKLHQNGIFIGNFIGNLTPGKSDLLFAEIKTFQMIFPNSYFFALQSPKSKQTQNIMFVGYNSDRKVSLDDFKKNDELGNIIDKEIFTVKRTDLENAIILTDNYSPGEYLTSKMMN